MSDSLRQVFGQTRRLFEAAEEAGWLSEENLRALDALEKHTPADLFQRVDQRPLTVAFFGGTGVGKSSLLNRLAGAPLARVGVERPTSREVTLYVHDAAALRDFPAGIPTDRIHVARHVKTTHRDILWIDSPDIDSADETNRELALSLLPFVDLIVYAVSPERYRDDAGWRILRSRADRQGWLFVMNHWDQGVPAQRDDFAALLRQAGFEEPLILCTSCAPDVESPSDQFGELERIMQALLSEHAVRELDRLGRRAQLQSLREVIEAASPRFGDARAWEQLEAHAAQRWKAAMETILEGADSVVRSAAAFIGTHPSAGPGWLAGLEHVRSLSPVFSRASRATAGGPRPAPQPPPPEAPELQQMIRDHWDGWAQARVDASLTALEVDFAKHAVAGAPALQRLRAVFDDARDQVTQRAAIGLRLALARSERGLRHMLRRVTGALMALLPLCALAWVGYTALSGFRAASAGEAPYLGTEFAVHGLLLVGIAWALPFAADRALKPRMELVARRGLTSGLAEGLERLGARAREAVTQARQESENFRSGLKLIRAEIIRSAGPVRTSGPTLPRVLADSAQTLRLPA